MDKKMLQRTFREYKKASGVAYAITNPDGLGDCQSCVNYALCEKYGEDSHGIYVKHWTRGMNGDYPLDHYVQPFTRRNIRAEAKMNAFSKYGAKEVWL